MASIFWKYLFPLLLLAIGVVTYFLVPVINEWVSVHIQGWWGLLALAVAGIALWLYFYFALGFRGKGLRYATIIIIYTAMCLWLLANFNFITSYLEIHFGTWGMIGGLIVIIAIVGLGLLVLF